ncbi:colanic acid biosynthesis fucosyltransferase WcaI [soil metagenome]
MSNKKSSVLIIGINFYPEPTGIGKYTAEFAFALAEKGFDVAVITSFPYYPQWKIYKGYKNLWYKKETIKSVRITRCPLYVPSSLSGLKRMLQDFSFFLTGLGSLLGKMLAGKSYDLVFVPSPSFMSGFLGLFYSFFYRKTKFVYHIQDLQVDAAEELGMINSGVLLKMLKLAEGLILKSADWVTTISAGMANRISAKPVKIKQQYLFPNWVDFSNIYKKEPDLSRISQLGFPTNKRLSFYSGAVGEKQGLEMVIDVAKLAAAQLPELVFVIAGSGPYANVLKQKAQSLQLNNLFFIELQPLDIFNELLNYAFLHLVIQKDKASDLLLPSKLTNILAVEGLAIVTASPGTTLYDIVATNELAFVVPPDNPDAFWNALLEINNTPEKVALLKSNAGRYAFKYLEKDTIINDFLRELNLLQFASAGVKPIA